MQQNPMPPMGGTFSGFMNQPQAPQQGAPTPYMGGINPAPNPMPTSTRTSAPNSVIYVGNLAQVVTEEDVGELARQHGNMIAVKLMKSFNTGQSRGFAFVTYASPEDAAAACEKLNFLNYKGRELKVYIKRKTDEFKKDANTFIRNLSASTTSKMLQELMEKHGKVLSCFVKYDTEGRSLCYGYCQFEKPEDAAQAIEKLNEQELSGSKIEVQKFIPRVKRSVMPNCNLYVRGFPKDWDEAKVNAYIDKFFAAFGTISSKCVMRDKKQGRLNAFVCFTKSSEAEEALKDLHDSLFEDEEGENKLYVVQATSKESYRKSIARNSTNVYIRGIRPEVSEEQFRKVFEKFGSITSLALKEHTISHNGSKVKSLCGFCNFEKSADAKEAIASAAKTPEVVELMNFDLVSKSNFITFFQKKEVRSKFLRAQRNSDNNPLNRMSKEMEMMFSRLSPHDRQILLKMMLRSSPMGRNPAFQNMMMYPQRKPFGEQNMMPGAQNPMQMQMQMPMMQQQRMYNMGNNMMMMNQNMVNPMSMNPQLFSRMGQPPMMGNLPNVPMKQTQRPIENHASLEWIQRNPEKFKSQDTNAQKNQLGTLLFPKIKDIIERKELSQEFTPKVTGMLIDLEVLEIEDIIQSLTHHNILEKRTLDAVDLIMSEAKNQPADN